MATTLAEGATTLAEDRWFVTVHIGKKVAQACGVIIPPLCAGIMLSRGRFTLPNLLRTTAKGTYKWAVPPSMYLGYGILYTAKDDDARTTARRLRQNKSQVRTDYFADMGGVVGASALAFIPTAGTLLVRLAAGSALGMAGGVLVHVATRPPGQSVPFDESRPNPHTFELPQWVKPPG